MTCQKEHKNFLATDPKELEFCELPEKEFKIIILRNLSEKSGKQINELGKIMHE